MSGLAISLLGSFAVVLDDNPLDDFVTDKGRALLAYLSVEADRPHRREYLADLLWPDSAASTARNSLRQAIHHLRKILTDSVRSDPYLLVGAKEIRFNPASDCWLDVAELEVCIYAARTHLRRGQDLCADCQARLESASELYKGDFMAGFSLPNCPRFMLWQLAVQESCRHRALEALAILASTCELQQEYQRVGRYSRRQIALDPLYEPAYRRYMRVLALNGEGCEALHQYDLCRKMLEVEMGVEPSAETTWLYQQILSGRLPEPN